MLYSLHLPVTAGVRLAQKNIVETMKSFIFFSEKKILLELIMVVSLSSTLKVVQLNWSIDKLFHWN